MILSSELNRKAVGLSSVYARSEKKCAATNYLDKTAKISDLETMTIAIMQPNSL